MTFTYEYRNHINPDVLLSIVVRSDGEVRWNTTFEIKEMLRAGFTDEEVFEKSLTKEEMEEIGSSIEKVEEDPFGFLKITLKDGTVVRRGRTPKDGSRPSINLEWRRF